MTVIEPLPAPVSIEVGGRLRKIRKAHGLSLEDVQRTSDGRWSASCICAYERGYRNVSLTQLHALAAFYDVPLTVLLTGDSHDRERVAGERRLVLDLLALDQARRGNVDGAEKLWAYARSIAVQRGDFNGRVLTLRRTDLPGIAALVGADTPDAGIKQLDAWGVLL